MATRPEAPGVDVHDIGSYTARLTISRSADNGSKVLEYEAFVLRNNEWPGAGGIVHQRSPVSFWIDRMRPDTQYFYTARARNALGWSPWAKMESFRTFRSVYVNIRGVQTRVMAVYVNIQGTWTPTQPYIKLNDEWEML